MRDKNGRQEPGGRRDGTRDHGLSRSWKVDVCEKIKKIKNDGTGLDMTHLAWHWLCVQRQKCDSGDLVICIA